MDMGGWKGCAVVSKSFLWMEEECWNGDVKGGMVLDVEIGRFVAWCGNFEWLRQKILELVRKVKWLCRKDSKQVIKPVKHWLQCWKTITWFKA